MERFNALEGVRGFFCLVVVLAHFEAGYHGKAFINAETLYYLVDIFFVFSGFLMSGLYWSTLRTRTDFIDYMIVRTGRVYPLHLVLLIVFIAFEGFRLLLPAHWLDTAPFTGTNDPIAIVNHLTLTQSMGFLDYNTWNFPSWSISTEYYAYIVFALLMILAKKYRIFIAMLLVTGSMAILAWWSEIGFHETIVLGFFRCLAGFMIGVLIYKYYARTKHFKAYTTRMTLIESSSIAGLLCFSLISANASASLLSPLVVGFLVWAFSYDAGAISKLFSSRILIYLGTISYSIYLNHIFLQDRILNIFKFLEIKGYGIYFIPDDLNYSKTADVLLGTNVWLSDFYVLLMLALLILISHFTYKWIEIPGREWAKRMVKKRKLARLSRQN